MAPWTATHQAFLSFTGLAPLLKTTDPNLSPSQSTHLEITPHNCVTKHEFILFLVKIFYSARRASRKKGIKAYWIFLSVKSQQSHHKTDKKRAELRIMCFWLNLTQWGFINEKSQCKQCQHYDAEGPKCDCLEMNLHAQLSWNNWDQKENDIIYLSGLWNILNAFPTHEKLFQHP